MGNPFVEVGKGIASVAKKFALAVAHLFGLARKIETVLKAEQPLEKPFIDGLVTVIGDVEVVLTDTQVAVTDGGINIPADSAAYQAFKKLYVDARELLPIVEDQLSILEGKPLPVPLANLALDNAAQSGAAAQTGASEPASPAPALHETVPA